MPNFPQMAVGSAESGSPKTVRQPNIHKIRNA
jgi:hypothetical protein